MRPDGENRDAQLAALRQVLHERYTVEREVGRGGMAVVYVAHDHKLDRRVAIKVMRPEVASAVGAERFLREIEIEAGLQHPSILSLHDSGTAADVPYYVMPYVEGESLRDRLEREGQLPLDDAVRIALDVAAGLSHAHGRGVVHRDIKPENILLSGGRAVIADFGVARALSSAADRLTATGVAVGTPAYMSPEQAGGESRIDGRSDLYALGCVLYEMLAGEPPFTGSTSSAVIAKHLGAPPPSVRVVRPHVPQAVEDIIGRALEKVAADRFATALELAGALEQAHTVDGGAPPPVRATPFRSRRRLLWLSLAGALGVAAVVVGTWRGLVASRNRPTDTLRQVAVLYARDLTSDHSLARVADRVTEGIIDRLSATGELSVLPAASVRRFRTSDTPLEAVTRAYTVGVVVETTVDSADDRFTAVIRVFDGASLRQVGTRTATRPASDALDVAELSGELGDFVRWHIGQRLRLDAALAGTRDERAQSLVQRALGVRDDALAVLDLGEPAAAVRRLQEADSLLGAAQALDSNWGFPVVQRAEVAWHRAIALGRHQLVTGDRTPDADAQELEQLRTGMRFADEALEDDSLQLDALEVRGMLRVQYGLALSGDSTDWWYRHAEQDLSVVVTTDSSRARAWHRLSFLYQLSGRLAEAAVAASRAWQADAFLSEAPLVLQTLVFGSLEVGWADSAAYWCQVAQRRFPGDVRFAECRLNVLGWFGTTPDDAEQAWAELEAIESPGQQVLLAETWGFRRFMVAAVLARAGLGDSALAVVSMVRRAASASDMEVAYDYYEAFVNAVMGNADRAMALLHRVVEREPGSAGTLRRARWFQPLWTDPRFQELTAGSSTER